MNQSWHSSLDNLGTRPFTTPGLAPKAGSGKHGRVKPHSVRDQERCLTGCWGDDQSGREAPLGPKFQVRWLISLLCSPTRFERMWTGFPEETVLTTSKPSDDEALKPISTYSSIMLPADIPLPLSPRLSPSDQNISLPNLVTSPSVSSPPQNSTSPSPSNNIPPKPSTSDSLSNPSDLLDVLAAALIPIFSADEDFSQSHALLSSFATHPQVQTPNIVKLLELSNGLILPIFVRILSVPMKR